MADSVLLSRCYSPPSLLASLQVCVFPLRAVLLRSCCLFISPGIFNLFLPFFDFDLDIVCFITGSFSSGYYAASSVSVSAVRLVSIICYVSRYLPTHADLNFLFLFESYTRYINTYSPSGLV